MEIDNSLRQLYLNKSEEWEYKGFGDISSLCIGGFWELEKLGRFIEKTTKENLKNLSKASVGTIEWHLEEIDRHINERFKSSLYYSYIVTIYSFVEIKLKKTCTLSRKKLQLKLSYKDISGSDLEKMGKYIKKVLNYDFSKNLNEEWRQIKTLNTVRNAIVHSEGCIKKDNATKIDYLIKQNLIGINDSDRIEIKHEYTVFLINIICKFIGTICDELLMKDRNKEILD